MDLYIIIDRGNRMIELIKDFQCEHGAANGKCKKVDCILQQGKWKGGEEPCLSFVIKDGNIILQCDDFEDGKGIV